MREKITISTEYELYNKLKRLSEMTRIPASRLFDEAIKDLLAKHNYDQMLADYKKESS